MTTTAAADVELARELAILMAADAQHQELVAAAAKLEAVALLVAAMPVVRVGDEITHDYVGTGHLNEPLVFGEGVPPVHEGVLPQVSAVFGIAHESALSMVAEVMELQHRLPRLWRLVQQVSLPAWRARLVARQTLSHPAVVAGEIDDYLAEHAGTRTGKITFSTVERLVREARLRHDALALAAEEKAAQEQRHVSLRRDPMAPGTADLWMRLDLPDALRLEARIAQIAHDLLLAGNTDPLDVRRALAAAAREPS